MGKEITKREADWYEEYVQQPRLWRFFNRSRAGRMEIEDKIIISQIRDTWVPIEGGGNGTQRFRTPDGDIFDVREGGWFTRVEE